jgi:hypothetical protein
MSLPTLRPIFPPAQLDLILAGPENIQKRIVGSKIVILLEQCMLAAIWSRETFIILLHVSPNVDVRSPSK